MIGGRRLVHCPLAWDHDSGTALHFTWVGRSHVLFIIVDSVKRSRAATGYRKLDR